MIDKLLDWRPLRNVLRDEPDLKVPLKIPIDGWMQDQPFWVTWLLERLGWTEFSHDTSLAKGWRLVGLAYTTVIGKSRAWCGMGLATAFDSGGIKPPLRAAAASSWQHFGEVCGFISGAVLCLRHATRKNFHVTVFLYWVDEKKNLAACLGCNQNNGIRITVYNLSGNDNGHDEVIGGPRWPKGFPKTGWQYQPGDEKLDTNESTR